MAPSNYGPPKPASYKQQKLRNDNKKIPNWMKTRYGRVQRQRQINRLYSNKNKPVVELAPKTPDYDSETELWKDFEEEIRDKGEKMIASGWIPGTGQLYLPESKASKCLHTNTVENSSHAEFAFEVTCADCGLVLSAINHELANSTDQHYWPTIGEDGGARGPGSIYQRVGYWNERINQLFCTGEMPPEHILDQIITAYKEETVTAKRKIMPTKSRLSRIILAIKKRILKQKELAIDTETKQKLDEDRREILKCAEKWIMIRCHITGEPQPKEDYKLRSYLKRVFIGNEIAFENIDHTGRKSIISINHIMARELQAYAIEYLDFNAASMIKFLPQLKSKLKLRNVSLIYDRMMAWQGRESYGPPDPKIFKGYK
jgi:hypothetical protein